MGPDADLYRHWLLSEFPAHAFREPELLPREVVEPDELEWQSRWFAGDFGRQFVTGEGEPVEILDFGWWNHGAGPDFRDCTVRIGEGPPRRGSIELDRDARDWEHHGHGANPAYQDVVLHLFLTRRGGAAFFTRTADHRAVPQVHLTPAAEPEPGRDVPSARPGRCLQVFRRLEPARIMALLESAARYRLERKARRFRSVSAIHGESQALYQALAAALGYSRNALPMTVLAQRLPLKFLQQRKDDAEALLFGVAGFLEGRAFDHADPETRTWLRGLWDHWWRYRDAAAPGLPRVPLVWNLAGSRPQNHPQRRVAALGALVRQWSELRRLTKPETFSGAALTKFLAGLRHAYWDRHYTLHAAPAARPLALIGNTRAGEILANVFYPILIPENPDLWRAYRKLKAPLDNEKTRRAALRLFAGHPDLAGLNGFLWQQQALLQIYEDFCLADGTDCVECPMPEKLVATE